MQEQKEKGQKTLKMRIRNQTHEKEILEFLQIHQYYEELQISIKLNSNQNHFNLLEKIQLDQYKNLTRLSLKILNISAQDLENVLTILGSVSNLKYLKFTLSYDKSKIEEFQYCLGKLLQQMTKLETLILDIRTSLTPYFSNLFLLNQAYKNFGNLQNLTINLKLFHSQSTIIKQMFEGIKSLKSLLSLSFSVNYHFGYDENFYVFNDEIRHLKNLKCLELELKTSKSFQKNKQKILQESLLCLTNLETFKLIIFISNYKDALIIQGLENLKNLKHFSFSNFNGANDLIIIEFLKQIQQLGHLQSVQLELNVTNYSISQFQIDQLLQSVQKIKNITYLKFEYPYSNVITQEVVLNFIASLKSLKLLKSLFLLFSQFKQNGQIKQSQIDDCQEVINNLKECRIRANENNNFDSVLQGNQFITILSSQQQLEKLTLACLNYQKNIKDQQQLQSLDFLNNNNSQFRELEILFNKKYSISEDNLRNLFKSIKNQQELTKLTLQILSLVGISNEMYLVISDSISSLQKLEQLKLNIKKLNFQNLESLSYFWKAIKSFKQLKILALKFYSNQELNIIFNEMSEAFENLINLKDLNLKIKSDYKKNLSTSFIQRAIFPSNLRNLSLKIVSDDMIFENVKEIYKSLQHLNKLKNLSINIDFSSISLTDMEFLSDILINLQYLSEITLDFKNFISIYLLNLFKYLPLLEYIDLGCPQIEFYSGYIFISREFNKNKVYEKEKQEGIESQGRSSINNNITDDLSLDIYCHKEISYENANLLGTFLQNSLINIFRIELSQKNKINGYFFQCLRNITFLQDLQININKKSEITTESIIELGDSLKHLQLLKQFDLQIQSKNDQIDWVQAKELFKGLRQISLLEVLNVQIKKNQSLQLIENLDFIITNISHLILLKQLKIEIGAKFSVENISPQLSKCFNGLSKLQKIWFNIQIGLNDKQQINEYLKCFFNLKSLNHLCLPNSIGGNLSLLYKIKRLVKILNNIW